MPASTPPVVPVVREIPGPKHAAESTRLQAALEQLEATFTQRNAARKSPFLRMQPATWEMSVGF
jgi:hypothetical protein